jgi:hypothetical protein
MSNPSLKIKASKPINSPRKLSSPAYTREENILHSFIALPSSNSSHASSTIKHFEQRVSITALQYSICIKPALPLALHEYHIR